jgi:four helix bundle protein
MKLNSYKDLIAWQKALVLVKEVYKLTKTLPENEKFNFVSQLNRSALSIPSNIAEGWGRESKGSFTNFLKIARGSLYELETQIIILKEVELVTEDYTTSILDLITEEIKILNSLIKSINNKVTKDSKS